MGGLRPYDKLKQTWIQKQNQLMKKFAIGCAVIGVVVVLFIIIFGLAGIGGYNRLVSQSQNVDKQWAQVQNDYQRRADLIPNLVQTVQGAANFEKSTLEAVTQARASVGQVKINQSQAPTDARQLAEFDKAQGQLSSALSRLLVVSERYPELKANSNFRDLQAQLEGTENRITVARRDFNEAVASYNTMVKSFPSSIYAGILHYSEKPYFNAAPGSETAPKVQFNFDNNAPAPAPSKP
jgi:LemA protein